ncbi:MAG: S8 family peptidase [Terriglobales bacterium]
MRQQTEIRTYPPLSSSAGWGAGNNDNKNGNEQPGQKPAGCGFDFCGGRIAALLVAFLVLLAAPGTCANGQGGHAQVSPPLQQLLDTAEPSVVVDIIVQYQVTPQQKHLDRVMSLGGRSKVHLGLIKSEAYTLPLSAVVELVNDADVAYVSLDNKVRLSSETGLDPSMQAVEADIAQGYGYDGSGVGIAIVDSGIYSHPDLNSNSRYSSSRVVYSQSFVHGDSSTGDAYGHGTHVAGLAAGNGESSEDDYTYEYIGVAPNANLINLRVLDANGLSTDSIVISAISQAISLKSKYNIQVMNLSLGRPVYESYTLDPLCQAVEQAWKAGIVVVVAAGNYGRTLATDGYATITAPGNDPYVITVGAIDAFYANPANDSVASFSSKGPTLVDHIVKPDIVASGNMVASLLAAKSALVLAYPSFDVYPCNWNDTSCGSKYGSPMYFTLSGTSMATPLVAGTAALMIQQNPSLTPDLVKARLMKTAFKGYPAYSTVVDSLGNVYQEEGDIFTYGAGVLNAAAAMEDTDRGSGAALSPTAVYNSKTGAVSLSQTTVSGVSVLWGTSVLWGSSVVWGTNVFVSGSSVLWGSSLVWGATTGSADAATSLIWGASVPKGGNPNQVMSDGDPGDCHLTSTHAVSCSR